MAHANRGLVQENATLLIEAETKVHLYETGFQKVNNLRRQFPKILLDKVTRKSKNGSLWIL